MKYARIVYNGLSNREISLNVGETYHDLKVEKITTSVDWGWFFVLFSDGVTLQIPKKRIILLEGIEI